MACQSVGSWETAPAALAACAVGIAVICCASSAGCSGVLVMKDQTEVCPLSRGVMLPRAQPLSLPLPEGLRFFRPPLPAALSVGLTVHVPWRERYGLPKLRLHHRMGTVRSFHRWC